MYLILKRQGGDTISATAGIVSKMVVYPNPVISNSFKLSFELKEQPPIAIKIYDLSGLIKHQQNLTTHGTGLQEQIIDFNPTCRN